MPHKEYGQVTPREFDREVMARLRQTGMSRRKRDVIHATAQGYLDDDHRRHGMSAGEVGEFMESISEEASHLKLAPKDIERLDDAVHKSL